MIVQKRPFLVVFLCLILLSAIGRAVEAAEEPDDLCEIPFTEGHRAAIEERYLPALNRLWERWAADDDPKVMLSGYTKTSVQQVRKNLRYYEDKIRSAVTQRDQIGALVSLPSREGSAENPAGRMFNKVYRAFQITAQEQKMLDEATQAFLHWSCYISNAAQFDSTFGFALRKRGDIFISPSYHLSFHDWRQLALIVHHQFSALPKPSEDWVYLAPVAANLMISNLYNPKWMANIKKADYRQRLQLDFVDWILGSDSDFQNKLRSIYFGALDDWEKSPTDPARRIIVQRVLRHYVVFVRSPEQQHSRSLGRKLVDKEVFLDFSIWVRQPNLSRCFFDQLLELTDDFTVQGLSENSVKDRIINYKFKMRDAFGPSWENIPKIKKKCWEIALDIIK